MIPQNISHIHIHALRACVFHRVYMCVYVCVCSQSQVIIYVLNLVHLDFCRDRITTSLRVPWFMFNLSAVGISKLLNHFTIALLHFCARYKLNPVWDPLKRAAGIDDGDGRGQEMEGNECNWKIRCCSNFTRYLASSLNSIAEDWMKKKRNALI